MIDKASLILKIVGTVLLLIACGIGIYNCMENYLAGQRAKLVLEQIQKVPSPSPANTNSISVAIDGQNDSDSDELIAPMPTQTLPATSELGYDTVGILTIARLGLELPILSECTESSLTVSICRYLGASQDKPDRLVIAGHNYKRHFGNLYKLVTGDKVLFTVSDGTVYCYVVTDTMEISGDDHDALQQGEWDMTLFTCSADGNRRILVRCQEVAGYQ